MMRRLPVFGLILLITVAAGAATYWMSLRGKPFDRALSLGLFLGAPLMELRAPQEGETHPQGGLAILVRFRGDERVAAETFRCLLNGQDLTHLLTRGRNGVGGSVFPLREGSNQLHLEVFGRSWLGRRYYRDVIERVVQVRSIPSLERARGPAPPGRPSPA